MGYERVVNCSGGFQQGLLSNAAGPDPKPVMIVAGALIHPVSSLFIIGCLHLFANYFKEKILFPFSDKF